VLTLAAMYGLRLMTHALGGWEMALVTQAAEAGEDPGRELGAITKNLSECREINTYYLYFVHAVTLVFLRQSPAEQKDDVVTAPDA